MDRATLEARVAKAIAKLPTDLDGLIERGKALERESENPDSAVPIREHLDGQGKGALFYGYSDGGGNSDSLWIIPGHDGLEALYLCYDHESPLNFYSYDRGEDFEYQNRLYGGLPLDLKELLADGPEAELLTIQSPEGDCHLYHGSAVLFLQDERWTAPESYLELALELGDDGGLRYLFDPERESEAI